MSALSHLKKRNIIDSISSKWMIVCLTFFVLLPLGIGVGLVLKSSGLLENHAITSLVFSSDWSPADGNFGFWPFILSSIWVTIVALLVSMPVCLLAGIYLTQFAPAWMLSIMRPVIDILAGIPSVVYGVWGILVVVPFVGNYSRSVF